MSLALFTQRECHFHQPMIDDSPTQRRTTSQFIPFKLCVAKSSRSFPRNLNSMLVASRCEREDRTSRFRVASDLIKLIAAVILASDALAVRKKSKKLIFIFIIIARSVWAASICWQLWNCSLHALAIGKISFVVWRWWGEELGLEQDEDKLERRFHVSTHKSVLCYLSDCSCMLCCCRQ